MTLRNLLTFPNLHLLLCEMGVLGLLLRSPGSCQHTGSMTLRVSSSHLAKFSNLPIMFHVQRDQRSFEVCSAILIALTFNNKEESLGQVVLLHYIFLPP